MHEISIIKKCIIRIIRNNAGLGQGFGFLYQTKPCTLLHLKCVMWQLSSSRINSLHLILPVRAPALLLCVWVWGTQLLFPSDLCPGAALLCRRCKWSRVRCTTSALRDRLVWLRSTHNDSFLPTQPRQLPCRNNLCKLSLCGPLSLLLHSFSMATEHTSPSLKQGKSVSMSKAVLSWIIPGLNQKLPLKAWKHQFLKFRLMGMESWYI